MKTEVVDGAFNHGPRKQQLMDFDDLKGEFVILSGVRIRDWPEFGHRGVSVDTSRNFQSKEVLMRIVDGMAHSKVQNEVERNFIAI